MPSFSHVDCLGRRPADRVIFLDMIFEQKNSGIFGIFLKNGTPLYIGSTENFNETFERITGLLKAGKLIDGDMQNIYDDKGPEEMIFTPMFYCEGEYVKENLRIFKEVLKARYKIMIRRDYLPIEMEFFEHFKGQIVSYKKIVSYLVEKGYLVNNNGKVRHILPNLSALFLKRDWKNNGETGIDLRKPISVF